MSARRPFPSRWACRTKTTAIRTTGRSTSSTTASIHRPARFRSAARSPTPSGRPRRCVCCGRACSCASACPSASPHQAMLVPQAAVGTDQGEKYLLVVDRQGRGRAPAGRSWAPSSPDGLQVVFPVKMVRDKEGSRAADETTPPKGPTVDSIQAGDRVIIGGMQRVQPGMEVRGTRPMRRDARKPAAIRVKNQPPGLPGSSTPNGLSPYERSSTERTRETPAACSPSSSSNVRSSPGWCRS